MHICQSTWQPEVLLCGLLESATKNWINCCRLHCTCLAISITRQCNHELFITHKHEIEGHASVLCITSFSVSPFCVVTLLTKYCFRIY